MNHDRAKEGDSVETDWARDDRSISTIGALLTIRENSETYRLKLWLTYGRLCFQLSAMLCIRFFHADKLALNLGGIRTRFERHSKRSLTSQAASCNRLQRLNANKAVLV